MALILAREQKEQEDSQQPCEKDTDEVDSPGHIPRATASHCERMEGRQDLTPSTSMAEVVAAPSGETAAAVSPKLKRKNAMSWKSGKKHKSPTAFPDAAPAVIAIARVNDTLTPLKTRNNQKNWPVIIALDSDSDATEEWPE